MNLGLVPSQKTWEASFQNRAGHKDHHYPQRIASEIDHKWQLISFPATLVTTEDGSADVFSITEKTTIYETTYTSLFKRSYPYSLSRFNQNPSLVVPSLSGFVTAGNNLELWHDLRYAVVNEGILPVQQSETGVLRQNSLLHNETEDGEEE